jgi:hypothetical protein
MFGAGVAALSSQRSMIQTMQARERSERRTPKKDKVAIRMQRREDIRRVKENDPEMFCVDWDSGCWGGFTATDADVAELAKVLPGNSHVQSIYLRGNTGIAKSAANSLIKVLDKCGVCEVFTVDTNIEYKQLEKMKKRWVANACERIAANDPAVQKLNWSYQGCRLNDRDLECLAQALTTNNHLLKINLCANRQKSAGINSRCEFGVTDAGARHLAAVISRCAVTVVDLSHTNVSKRARAELKSLCTTNAPLIPETLLVEGLIPDQLGAISTVGIANGIVQPMAALMSKAAVPASNVTDPIREPSNGETIVTITFTELHTVLGLRLGAEAENCSCFLDCIMPDGNTAALSRGTRLARGWALTHVQGKAWNTYREAVAAVKAAGRPLALTFSEHRDVELLSEERSMVQLSKLQKQPPPQPSVGAGLAFEAHEPQPAWEPISAQHVPLTVAAVEDEA